MRPLHPALAPRIAHTRVGEVAPGAEDPSYNDPMHLQAYGRAQRQNDPFHLSTYGQTHGSEESANTSGGSQWYNKPIAGDIHSPDTLPRVTAMLSTPKNLALALAAVAIGVKVLT